MGCEGSSEPCPLPPIPPTLPIHTHTNTSPIQKPPPDELSLLLQLLGGCIYPLVSGDVGHGSGAPVWPVPPSLVTLTTSPGALWDDGQKVTTGGGCASGRSPYRQAKIRAQISLLETELSAMEALLESGEAANDLRSKVDLKRLDIAMLRRELERLISGQMRQRKFRAKLKMMANCARNSPDRV